LFCLLLYGMYLLCTPSHYFRISQSPHDRQIGAAQIAKLTKAKGWAQSASTVNQVDALHLQLLAIHNKGSLPPAEAFKLDKVHCFAFQSIHRFFPFCLLNGALHFLPLPFGPFIGSFFNFRISLINFHFFHSIPTPSITLPISFGRRFWPSRKRRGRRGARGAWPISV
jgi:hypothetical protein